VNLFVLGYGPVESSCKRGNEHSVPQNVGNFLSVAEGLFISEELHRISYLVS
jgi:hypothetical protein